MCGRYTLYQTAEIPGRFGISPKRVKELKERYNIAPGSLEPVIVQKTNDRSLETMKWGFMAPWMKDFKDMYKYKMFNTRAEGVFEKRTWKKAILNNRCLIPSNGFYEWIKTSNGKQPFFIKPKDQDLFAFAGVYGHWKDAEGNEWGTYSILTTKPNREMSTIHDREPVMLRPEDEDLWLEPSNDNPEAIASLLKPYEDGMLNIVEVSRDVNATKSDEARFIQPIHAK